MYTPTTDQIRTEWALSNPGGSPTTIMHAEAAFDRWLTEHDRQVAERAWDEAIQHQWVHRPIGNRSPHNPYRKDAS